jgi:hypothetical protein
MKITQVSVFLENRKGRLLEVCSLLGKHNINIRALNVAESEGFGVLRIVVDKPQEAVEILKKENLVANLTDVVAAEVEDKPGGLAKVLEVLNKNNINVEYMYGFMEKFSDKALLVFRFDDPQKAAEALKKNGINIVTEAPGKGM